MILKKDYAEKFSEKLLLKTRVRTQGEIGNHELKESHLNISPKKKESINTNHKFTHL